MSEVRPRKPKSQKRDTAAKKKDGSAKPASAKPDSADTDLGGFLVVLSVIVGIVAMVTVGYIHANYMATLHENWMWFTNIKVRLSRQNIYK